MLDKVAIDKSVFDMKKSIYEQYYKAKSQLGVCLRGVGRQDICKNRKEAEETIQTLKSKTRKLKSKVLQKRL